MRSRSLPMVVPQHPAKPLTTANSTFAATDFFARLNNAVLKALMIPFLMIMNQELPDGLAQCVLSEKDHSVEALVLDRTHESFDVLRQIRRPGGQTFAADALILHPPEVQGGTAMAAARLE